MTSLVVDGRRIAPRRTVLALVLGALAMVPLLPGGFSPLDVRVQLVLGSVSVSLLAAAALQLIGALPGNDRGLGRWLIGPWFLVWSGVAFGLASLTWLGPQTGSARQIALSSVLNGLTVFGVGLVAWTLGYALGPPGTLVAGTVAGLRWLLSGVSTRMRGGAMPWMLYAAGSAARLTSIMLTGHFGYVGDPSSLVTTAAPYAQVFAMLSNLAVFGIAGAAYRAFDTRTRGNRATLWTLVGMEAVVGALGGGKESFVISLLAVLIPYGATRRRVPLRLLVLGTAVFLLVIVPFNTAYRGVVRGEQSTLTPSAAVSAAPDVLTGVVRSGSPTGTLTGSATALMYRIREIDSISIITQRTPASIPYRSPLEYLAAPGVGVVPRALWPDKPILDAGYEFSQDYYGLPSSTYTSTAVTPVGDLYRHGGPAAVVCGMLLLGVGYRLLDRLVRPESDPRMLCFVLVFLPLLVKSELDLYSMLASIPSGILTAALGARLMCRSTRQPESA